MGFGFRMARSTGMEGSTGNLHEFLINPADTDKIHTGDPVILNAGYIESFAAGAVTNSDVLGIFAGCRYVEADGSIKYASYWDGGAGRTDVKAQVIVPNNGQSLLAELGVAGATAFTQAMVGRRVGFTAAAGNDATGQSGAYVTNGAAVATGPFVIWGLADIPEHNVTRVYVEVGLARPQLGMQVVA